MPTTGQAAQRIGVNITTISNWIDRPELNKFFSTNAGRERTTSRRELSHADMDVILTINYLTNIEKIADWDKVAEYLESGQRETDYPISGRNLDTRSITLDQAEQSAKAAATVAERDAALRQVELLKNQLTQIQGLHQEELLRQEEKYEERLAEERERYEAKIDLLQQQINKLNREVGRLEGRLEDDD